VFRPATATLLALADQRLPSGGHVHSGGVEQAVSDGLVTNAATLGRFLHRRLLTTGLVTAGLAAAAARVTADSLAALDAEADARMPSPAAREASRAQGRGLLRTARAAWAAPGPGLAWSALGARPHHPVVLGCCAQAAGLSPDDTSPNDTSQNDTSPNDTSPNGTNTSADGAALVAAYLTVTGPATAAQRLLALDPVAVAALTLALSDEIEAVAREAALAASGPWSLLPDAGDPALDLLLERHAPRGDRLFAS
jgi:urease accessory protein